MIQDKPLQYVTRTNKGFNNQIPQKVSFGMVALCRPIIWLENPMHHEDDEFKACGKTNMDEIKIWD